MRRRYADKRKRGTIACGVDAAGEVFDVSRRISRDQYGRRARRRQSFVFDSLIPFIHEPGDDGLHYWYCIAS